MSKPMNPPSTTLRVSASELAQMGVCERLVVFEKRHGKRRTMVQRRAIERGLQAHQRFYRRHIDASANEYSIISTWIASVLYGWLRQAVRSPLRPLRWCIARWTKVVERNNAT